MECKNQPLNSRNLEISPYFAAGPESEPFVLTGKNKTIANVQSMIGARVGFTCDSEDQHQVFIVGDLQGFYGQGNTTEYLRVDRHNGFNGQMYARYGFKALVGPQSRYWLKQNKLRFDSHIHLGLESSDVRVPEYMADFGWSERSRVDNQSQSTFNPTKHDLVSTYVSGLVQAGIGLHVSSKQRPQDGFNVGLMYQRTFFGAIKDEFFNVEGGSVVSPLNQGYDEKPVGSYGNSTLNFNRFYLSAGYTFTI